MAPSFSSFSLADSFQLKNRSTRFYFIFLIFFLSLILISLLPRPKPPTLSLSSTLSTPSQPPISAFNPLISNSSIDSPPQKSAVDSVPRIGSAETPVLRIAAIESPPPIAAFIETPLDEEVVVEDGGQMCNLYDGTWVKDEEEGRYPLYKAGSCPFVDDAFTCQENGRPDKGYLKWRWQPNDCDLVRTPQIAIGGFRFHPHQSNVVIPKSIIGSASSRFFCNPQLLGITASNIRQSHYIDSREHRKHRREHQVFVIAFVSNL